MASAYSPFVNGGNKVVARAILKVTDGSGNVIFNQPTAPDLGQVLTPSQAWEMTSILRNYPHIWDLGIKYDTAGKSGTTDQFVDAWYMSFTPSWVIATWAGHTSDTTTAEQANNELFGVSAGQAITAPFVNSLPQPAPFQAVSGAAGDCDGADRVIAEPTATFCATPTPTPVPATPTPAASAAATPTPSPSPISPTQLPPTATICAPTSDPQATPCPP